MKSFHPIPGPGTVAVVLGAGLCLWLTGWFGLNLRDPLSFNGDHMLWLGYARSFIEGHGFRWSDSLGFPGMRDHMYHPTFYLSQKSLMWITARFLDNPAAVISAFYGFGIVFTYGACYWALRRLSIGRALSVVGGVAFVVTPFFAFRAGNHDPFAVYYSVPLGAALALRVGLGDDGTRAVDLRRRLTDPPAWLLVLLVSASGVYFAFFTVLFVMFAGTVAGLARQTVAPAAQAAVLSAGMVIGLLVTGPGLGLIDILNGTIQVPARQPFEQSLYGLSVGDAVKSLAHAPFTPAWWAHGVTGMDFEGTYGEWPGLLLTLVILASPAIALGVAMTSPSAGGDRRRQVVALCAGLTAFGVFFAARGGLGLLFNQIVTASFRAQSRIMPFLIFFAIVIVLVWVQQVAPSPRRWMRILGPVVLVGGLVASIAESTPRLPLQTMQRAFLASESQAGNRQSILDMNERLRASGARTVLQLPIVSWPEVAPIRGFTPYHFELPHVLDRAHSGVRWSYGMSTGQPMFTRLQAVIDAHREHRLVAAAAGLGFDAISIEKGALAAPALAAWIEAIEADLDPACRVFDDARRLLYVFPASSPDGGCGPSPEPLSFDSLRYVTAEGRFGRTRLVGGGWSAAEGGYTWTHDDRAIVNVPAASTAPGGAVEVTFDFMVFRHDPQKPKRIVFQVNGRDHHRIDIGAGQPPPGSATFTISAEHIRRDGSIEVVILTPDAESPADYGAPDPRRLGIALFEFRVRAVP